MGEQSHKSEMRAALQGDFERLRARRLAGTGAAVVEPSAPAPSVAEAPVAGSATPEAEQASPSWRDRLRGRR